jgi:outer membrane protease
MARLAAAALAAGLAACAPGAALAQLASLPAAPAPVTARAGGASFSLEASVGMLGGTATERAFSYPQGSRFKISELNWDLEGVALGGVQAAVGIGRRVRLGAGFWTALTDGSGMMVDRDWLYSDAFSAFVTPSDANWTHESRHPDTSVDTGRVFDLNLAVTALEGRGFTLSGILGWRSETWGWTARGGTFVYSDEGFRDTVGSFADGVEVIAYEQQFTVPYVGVGVAWEGPTLRLDGRVLASGLVSATDHDYHALRDVTYDGDFSRGAYLGLGVGAAWSFAPRWRASLAFAYESFSEIIGDVTMSGAEGSGTFGSAGGIALESATASLGVGFSF